jgi:fibronectin-binding autotransporter adhesin
VSLRSTPGYKLSSRRDDLIPRPFLQGLGKGFWQTVYFSIPELQLSPPKTVTFPDTLAATLFSCRPAVIPQMVSAKATAPALKASFAEKIEGIQTAHSQRIHNWKIHLMKPKASLLKFLALAGSSLLAVSAASAQTGTWNVDANGLWGTDTNWASNTIADGAANTANFTNNITADRTVSLDTDRTINRVNFADSTTSSAGSWILDNNGTSTNNLILSGTTGAASGTVPVISVATLGTGKNATISAVIEGSYGFSKAGTGTLVLSGDNTYTGVTTHVPGNGIIIVAHNNALGSTADGSHTNITLSNGDSQYIGINNGVNTPENFTISGSSTTGSTAIRGISGTATLSGTITLAGTGQIRLGAGTGGSGTLIWAGTITQSTTSHGLVFYGNNTVSNAMTINGGGLTAVNGTVTLNAVNGTGIGSAGTFGGNFTLGVTNALNTVGDFNFAGGGSRLNLNGNNQTIKGLTSAANTGWTVSNEANNATTSTLTVGNGGGDYSFGGRIINAHSGNGIVALVKTGAGNQTLTGINTFTGGTRIDDGTLTLGHATDTLANGGAINVNGGTLALGANNDTVGAVTLTSGSITGSGGTLTGSSYAVESGSVSAILGGSGALTKSSAGTVTLTGANSYSGGTTVSVGKLVVNNATGSGTGSGAVTVETGGALGGSGTIAGAVTVDGALSPGNSTGLLSVGSLNLNANSSTTLEINGTDRGALTDGYDAVGVGTGGSIDLAGALSFVFGNVSAFANNTVFDLFSFDTTSTGDFTGVTSTGFYTGTWGKTGDIWSLTDEGQTLNFSEVTGNLTVIPEPKAAILGVLGLLALLRRRR